MNDIDALLDQALTEKSNDKEIEYITINEKSRLIEAKSLLLGVKSDEKTERIYFKMPRYVGDNVDLMDSRYKMYINYENAEGVMDMYLITDRAADEENMTFSWLLSRMVTNVNGTVLFSLCVKKTQSDGTITNEWNTTIANGEVLEGLEASEVIVEYCSDIITHLVESLDSLEDTIDKDKLQSRNLLRESWLTEYDGLKLHEPFSHFLDTMNYIFDGSALYVKTEYATSNMGFYINNVKGMRRSTFYEVSFKARRKENSPKIFDILVDKGVNHESTAWYLDDVKIGAFGTRLEAEANTVSPKYLMDDFKWHTFELHFNTSDRPEIIPEDELNRGFNGDVVEFNGKSCKPCTIEIKELQWKKSNDFFSGPKGVLWSRAPDDMVGVDLIPLYNRNTLALNLLKEEWLSTEQTTEIGVNQHRLIKSHFGINRSFTYILDYSTVLRDVRGFRINHFLGMRPSTKYRIHFKLRRINGSAANIRLNVHFNHSDINCYVDGVKVNGFNFNPNIEYDPISYMDHDFLIEFTTSDNIQRLDSNAGFSGDTISINDNVYRASAVNIIDFLWMDADQNEDLYQSLIYNRQIFENRNLLRNDWLTDCQVEVK